MVVLQIIMQSLFSVLIIAFVIMFQPDLQRIVEQLGTNKIQNPLALLKSKNVEERYYSEDTIKEIIQACEIMSEAKTGALIVLEREIPLSEYIESGISVKANVSNQLLINTFEKNTPLHDGAVVIKNDRLEAATCYLPLSKSKGIKKTLGTRHRAGIGLSENSDAIIVVVSEETGHISVCYNGKIKEDLTRASLYDFLLSKSFKSDKKKKSEVKEGTSVWFKLSIVLSSVLLWSLIINIEDPITTKTFPDIPVKVLNNEVLTDAEKTYEIIQGNTIIVRARGKRSVINNMSKSSFSAVADFSEMSIVNAIPIRVSAVPSDVELKIVSDDIMKLELEDLIQTEVQVSVNASGKVSEGHYLAEVVPDVSSVIIKGSKTLVNTIGRAEASVDVSGLEMDTYLSSPIIIYDKNGEVISSELVSVSSSNTDVAIKVFNTKEVAVKVELSDDKNYRLLDYEIENILVAANDSLLNRIDEISVVLDPSKLDLSKKEFLVNLSLYMPEGVYLPETQSESITLQLDIEKE